jgi:hypothetical protein
VSTPEKATLSSGTMATIIVAARAIHPCEVSLDDVYARAKEQQDKAALEDFAALGTIADAVMVVVRGQRRDLR